MMKKLSKDVKVAGYLAYKNIIFNKKSLILIGAIIGLTYLSGIFIGGVINGLQVLIENKIISTLTGNIILLPKDNENYITNVKDILNKLKNVPGVIEASPRYSIPVTLVDKDGNEVSINLFIVDPDRERRTTDVSKDIVEGRYLSKGTDNGIVIGGVITKKYGIFKTLKQIEVSSGDKVRVLSPFGNREVKILGIYRAGVASAELYGYINKKQVEKLFGINIDEMDMATQIVVKTQKKGEEKKIVKLMRLSGINNVKIRTWEEQLGTLSQFTDSLMIMNKIALAVSIIVAFGVIYIMMYINAFQKRSQLGILKAIGIRGNILVLSYVIQSIFYGLFGILLGFLLTKLVVYYFTYHPISMPFGDVVPVLQEEVMMKSALFILISSIFAGYYSSKNIVHGKILDMIFKG